MKQILLIVIILLSGITYATEDYSAKIDSVTTSGSGFSQEVGVLRNFSEDALNKYLLLKRSKEAKSKVLNALCWMKFVSDPRESMEYAQQQLTLAKELNDPVVLIASYDNLSYLHLNNSENTLAIDYMLKSLKAKEQINDQAGISVSISGLATTYYQLKNFELALDYFEQSMELEKKNNDTSIEGIRRRAALLGNIGQCKIELGQIDDGMRDLKSAISLYESENQKNYANTVYGNLGLAYFKHKENYTEALKYFFISEKLSQAVEEYAKLASIQSSIAEVYAMQGNFVNALKYGKKALRNAQQSASKDKIMGANQSLAIAFYRSGNYKLAYEHFNEAFKLKDTIFTAQSAKQIAEMQTKYDTEKKEAENKLLKTKQELDRAELKRKSSQQKMLLFGLLIVVIVSIYIAYSLIQKKKVNKLLNKQNTEISSKNKIIEEKNKDITDSINYAKRIQNAILPDDGLLTKHFKSFIYYRPKDIVSGDFYWVKEIEGRVFFSVIDCTGHGVPGAFMSIIGYNALNRIVEESEQLETGEILDRLNDRVIESIAKQSDKGITIRDGMDMSFCCYDDQSKELQYTGAHNSLYYLREKGNDRPNQLEVNLENKAVNLFEVKADKMAIGGDKNETKYTTHVFDVTKGDTIYLFSDGYADQFGGPKGKKFMYKRFKKLLLDCQSQPMSEQLNILDSTMVEWMGDLDQLDDICVMGVRF